MAKDIFIQSAEFTLRKLIESCESADNEDCGFNVYLHDFCDVVILFNNLARSVNGFVYKDDQGLRLSDISSLFRNVESNKYISLTLYDMVSDILIDSSDYSFNVLEKSCDIRDARAYVHEFISLINRLRGGCLKTINDINAENNYFRRFFYMNAKIIKEITDNLIKSIHADDYIYFSCEILSLSLLFKDIMRMQSDKLHEEKFTRCVLDLNHYINDLLFKQESSHEFPKRRDIENVKAVVEVFKNGVSQSNLRTSNRISNTLSLLCDDINRSIVWLTEYENVSDLND